MDITKKVMDIDVFLFVVNFISFFLLSLCFFLFFFKD